MIMLHAREVARNIHTRENRARVTPAIADDTIVLSPRSEPGPYRVDAGSTPACRRGAGGARARVRPGITRECGCVFAYGVRLAIAGITESSEAYDRERRRYRLRVTGAAPLDRARRAVVAARRRDEHRLRRSLRNGGDRAGLMGDALGRTRSRRCRPPISRRDRAALIGPWLLLRAPGRPPTS